MRGLFSLMGAGLRHAFGGSGAVVMILGAVAALITATYSKGVRDARATCRAVALQSVVDAQGAELRRIDTQLRAANQARDDARAKFQRDALITQQARKEADAFKDEIAARADHCPVSPVDAERLRRIGR